MNCGLCDMPDWVAQPDGMGSGGVVGGMQDAFNSAVSALARASLEQLYFRTPEIFLPPAPPPPALDPALSSLLGQTVMVRTNGSQGTGVILGEKNGKLYVLTASHVVDPFSKEIKSEEIQIVTAMREELNELSQEPEKVVYTNGEVTILEVPLVDKALPPGMIATLPVGTAGSNQVPVATIGYPGALNGERDRDYLRYMLSDPNALIVSQNFSGTPYGLNALIDFGLLDPEVSATEVQGETLPLAEVFYGSVTPGSSGGALIGPDGKIIGLASATGFDGKNLVTLLQHQDIAFIQSILGTEPRTADPVYREPVILFAV